MAKENAPDDSSLCLSSIGRVSGKLDFSLRKPHVHMATLGENKKATNRKPHIWQNRQKSANKLIRAGQTNLTRKRVNTYGINRSRRCSKALT